MRDTLMRSSVKTTGFAEYDHLSGYVVDQYVTEWTGPDGTRYRKEATVINLGRPDRGVPVADANVDEDEEVRADMTPEPQWFPRGNRGVAMRDRVAASHAQLQKWAGEYLRQHGPTPIPALATRLGVSENRLARHILTWEHEVYCRVGDPVWRKGQPWGLIGVHDGTVRR